MAGVEHLSVDEVMTPDGAGVVVLDRDRCCSSVESIDDPALSKRRSRGRVRIVYTPTILGAVSIPVTARSRRLQSSRPSIVPRCRRPCAHPRLARRRVPPFAAIRPVSSWRRCGHQKRSPPLARSNIGDDVDVARLDDVGVGGSLSTITAASVRRTSRYEPPCRRSNRSNLATMPRGGSQARSASRSTKHRRVVAPARNATSGAVRSWHRPNAMTLSFR